MNDTEQLAEAEKYIGDLHEELAEVKAELRRALAEATPSEDDLQ